MAITDKSINNDPLAISRHSLAVEGQTNNCKTTKAALASFTETVNHLTTRPTSLVSPFEPRFFSRVQIASSVESTIHSRFTDSVGHITLLLPSSLTEIPIPVRVAAARDEISTQLEASLTEVTEEALSKNVAQKSMGKVAANAVGNSVINPVFTSPIDAVIHKVVIEKLSPLQVVKESKFKDYYRGIGSSVAGGLVKFPTLLISMQVFDNQTKHVITDKNIRKVSGGIFAAVIESIVGNPFSVMKDAVRSKKANSCFDFIKQIVTGKIGVKSLYRGFGGTALRSMGFNAIYPITYEKLNETFGGDNPNYSVAEKVAVGFGSGSMAGVVSMTATYPLNNVILTQRHNDDGKSLLETCVKMVKTQGLKSLGKGYVLGVLRIFVGTGMFGVIVPTVDAVYDAVTKKSA